ncbi:hypothetical protein MKEN_00599100 [Mycena kentingensis (nom. inval.)]|nr:hypothetical protein MKEN_00599100 [Mycena kentingensis (nom. inval.)]
MTTPLRIHFPGSDPPFIGKRWKIPDHTNGPDSFHILPAETTDIYIRQLFRNSRINDGMRLKVAVKYARIWGVEDEPEIIYARAETADSSHRFCLRFIFNARLATNDKLLETYDMYQRLIADAKFHSRQLMNFAGTLVPRHFGMWLMETADWAGTVLFSLTQWCGVPFSRLLGTAYDTLENRLLVGRTFEMLHDHGILYDSHSFTKLLGHVLIDIHDPAVASDPHKLLTGMAPCYIVSFPTAAAHHACQRKIPVVPLGSYVRHGDYGCRELVKVLFALDFFEPRDDIEIDTPTEDVLKWHTAYMKHNGALVPCNGHALIALRAKLFPKHRPLYGHTFDVKFSGHPEYPLVQLLRKALPASTASSGASKCAESISVRTSSAGSDSSEEL